MKRCRTTTETNKGGNKETEMNINVRDNDGMNI